MLYHTDPHPFGTGPAGTVLHYVVEVTDTAATLGSLVTIPNYVTSSGERVYPRNAYMGAFPSGAIWLTYDGEDPDPATYLGLKLPEGSQALTVSGVGLFQQDKVRLVSEAATGIYLSITFEF